MRPQNLNYILSSIAILKGVGPKLEKIINKLGIIKNVHFWLPQSRLVTFPKVFI